MAKEPKDENDPTRLRWYAKRVAEMKWWGENEMKWWGEKSKSVKPAEPQEQPSEAASQQQPGTTSQEPQAQSDEQQPPMGSDPSSEGEIS
jgi:hypothetical protein